MSDELREKAKAFRINSTSKFRPDYMLSTNMAEQLMAMFAAECVRAEWVRIAERLTSLSKGPQSWEAFKGGVITLIDELRGDE